MNGRRPLHYTAMTGDAEVRCVTIVGKDRASAMSTVTD